jgi:adenine-specific DNA-methyltransferase
MAKRPKSVGKASEDYRHLTSDLPLRPEVGTQAQFKKKKPPKTYKYDSSLSPAFEWDGQNPAREQAEAHIREIDETENLDEAKAAAAKLKALGQPFLNWAGKAERLSFDVPTLPLFVHERLSTKAILETLKSHERDKQADMFDLFGDPRHPIADQVLKAYEYRDDWVNRLILGDSLVVMNSLLEYEGIGGQVQMIYVDPPYGVRYGTNFQPFVRKRPSDRNDDEDLTREPEMVRAYRDTWELGLHSYLTYLRDRLLVARDLLTQTGSIFVQISDENIHHVREVLDEVFGSENFVSQISFQTTSGFSTRTLATLGDFLLWYARNKERIKVRKLYEKQELVLGEGNARWVLLPDGSYRGVTAAEKRGEVKIPEDARLYKPGDLQSQGAAKEPQPFDFQGRTYKSKSNSHWKANYPAGMERLGKAGRIHVAKNSIQYRRFADDFPFQERGNIWTDTRTGSFTDEKLYAVQTNPKVIERCILLSTDPGDLVLDPTCGGGTTAYASERWGRRWITIDTSRIPLALTRQRLLTATYDFSELKDEAMGPSGGFVYERRQNSKGEEIGGVVPHIKLETIANDEPPSETVLVDNPEVKEEFIRVTGPFVVEATIPTPVDWEGDGIEDSGDAEDHAPFVDRMLAFLWQSPIIRLPDNREVKLKNIRPPARALVLSAEAAVEATEGGTPTLGEAIEAADEKSKGKLPLSDKPVAIVFGPENGSVSEKLAYEAAREAYAKSYSRLLIFGFGIEPNARKLVEDCEDVVGLPAIYIQATPDVIMGDLLKTMRTSQIFSVCGLPEVTLVKTGDGQYQAKLIGLDVFDPLTMESDHRSGTDVPAWFLDTNYNDLCFHVCQAFFPRTAAWDAIKKSLGATYEEDVWAHLAGDTSAPFEAGAAGKIAVKVIDDRGNELMVVKALSEAKPLKEAAE